MTAQEIQDHVLAALREAAPDADTARIDPDVNFRDQYEIDSVDFLNFVLRLETLVDRSIPEVDYPKLSSLRGCLRYLADTQGA